jgi:hypothetical protein
MSPNISLLKGQQVLSGYLIIGVEFGIVCSLAIHPFALLVALPAFMILGELDPYRVLTEDYGWSKP